MNTAIKTYLDTLNQQFKAGNATEHTHRPTLQNLLTALLPNYQITNEPRRIQCGAPDYVIAQGEIPIGHIEAKDIGISLDKTQKTEQLKRYLDSLHNLILTDYLEFRWYINGQYQADLTVKLAEIKNGKFVYLTEHFNRLENLLNTFVETQIITLKSPEELATKMAKIAQQIKYSILLAHDEETEDGKLHNQLKSFREVLLDTLTIEQFADMVAQTICYGLFAAKCNANTAHFSRLTAVHFVAKTNPFLQKFFNQLVGIELDERLIWMVEHLVAVLNRADIASILSEFGKRTRQEDPVIHFYETFLASYDAKLREVRGVYYTPEPVVSYIVRSVDLILKDKFNLKKGLADNSTLDTPTPNPSPNRGGEYIKPSPNKGEEKAELKPFPNGRGEYIKPSPLGGGLGGGNIHKVQILDPATGTGTFLYSVIAQIYSTFSKNKGMWSDYVSQHLLPRVHGFEFLMAAYTVAHIKLSLQLKEYGYDFKSNERLRVFLTNTLEQAHGKQTTLLSEWLSDESNAASHIKRDMPVMVILGNPPYSYISMNNEKWINDLIKDYYSINGELLKEKNPKGLQDDYVKFIRFAQWRIKQTGYGVLAFVTNHGYLDNPTFRGMRYSLLQDFDEIYILDLHGNAKKKETALDGSLDKNVFDIQQGVAIGIFIKYKTPNLTPTPTLPQKGRENNSTTPSEGSQQHSPSPSGGRVGMGETINTQPIKENKKPLKLPDWLLENARNLRKSATDAEQLLWGLLRGKRFLNLKFRRQHPIPPYILDFYCHELKLAIELDGGQHNNEPARIKDEKRSLFLNQQGITVLRFWNNDVLQQTDSVLESIYLQVITPTPTLPQKGREFDSPSPKGESISPSPLGGRVGMGDTLPSPSGRGAGGEGATVFHAHLYGKRESKYQYLAEHDIKTTDWTELKPQAPFYLFVPQNTDLLPEYNQGWKITEMMPINSTGVKTHRDHFVFDFDKAILEKRIADFRNLKLSDDEIAERYDLKNTGSFNLTKSRKALANNPNWQNNFIECLYRPFDKRHYYHDKTVVDRSRDEIIQHLIKQENLSLISARSNKSQNQDHFFCSDTLIETKCGESTTQSYFFPLYIYPTEKTSLFDLDHETRQENYSPAFIRDLESKLQLRFINEGLGDFKTTVSALDVFYYSYAVFHSPSYRTRYAEFLKIDFPRLPLTSDKTLFKNLSELGEQLVNIHLMSAEIESDACFPITGNNTVEKVQYADNKVYINKTQYFDNVSSDIWQFHIGGYQVCQKWLKDRKDRVLSFDDCSHYLYIVGALEQTQLIMQTIDELLVFPVHERH